MVASFILVVMIIIIIINISEKGTDFERIVSSSLVFIVVFACSLVT